MTQRTALVLLGGLALTLAGFVVTGSHALVGVMGLVLVLVWLGLEQRRP